MDAQVIELSNPLWLQTLEKVRHDIYHLPEYVGLEASRTQAVAEAILIEEGDKLFFVPYLLRHCDRILNLELTTQKVLDVVSPYGYPGILVNEAATSSLQFLELALAELINILRAKQVCSIFLRLHPILNRDFNKFYSPHICKVNGETISINLKLSVSEIWQQTKPNQRNAINKCKRAGLTARMVSFKQYLNEFVSIYQETMERVKAKKHYYSFDYDYFLHLTDAIGDKLHLCIVEQNEEIACAGLYTECCGIVQSTLGGTKTKFIKQSPSSLETDYARFWAKERGNEVLHLGGGVGGFQDSVYFFKAGFSKQKHTFLTLRIITNENQYFNLANLHAKSLNADVTKLLESDFFPVYRCPKLNEIAK